LKPELLNRPSCVESEFRTITGPAGQTSSLHYLGGSRDGGGPPRMLTAVVAIEGLTGNFPEPFFLVCHRSPRRIFFNTGACLGHTKCQFLQFDRFTRHQRTLIHLSASHLQDMRISNQSTEICYQSANYKARTHTGRNTEQARRIETDELKPNDPEFNA
jgi:hypothetical protein